MIFDDQDTQTICAYIRAEQPACKGPIFIDLKRLEQLHMYQSYVIVNAALRKAAKQRA